MEKKFMQTACELASLSITRGSGPFGAIVVKNDTNEIVGRGHNMVTIENDPTLHAEIVAIRNASRFLNTFVLNDCTLYTSCEPCPMCLSASYWARIPVIYYGNTKTDAKNIGFDDEFIYEEFNKKINERNITMIHLDECSDIAKKAFEEWKEKEDKTPY
jgi:tRNA(Arg) A34 adenosine deaminase TadA